MMPYDIYFGIFLIIKSIYFSIIFSCISNARFQVHHDKRIKVTALRDIPKGTEITISYCPSNAGNTLRRAKIKKNWYFDCQCER